MPSVSALFRQPDLEVLSHLYLWVLALKLHHLFASKFLINQLSKLGFSVSYDEIIRFKQSSVLSTAPGDVTCYPFRGAFTQWVADNVDHNIRTLDSHDTFHGMGIISASTSLSAMSITPSHTIPRLKVRLPVCELKGKGIKIVPRSNQL